jgi:GNAT superfamily N-acetyltransferase
MIELSRALRPDAGTLIETQVRAFQDDNKNKPAGCSLEIPPGCDSLEWNMHWIEQTHYYKIMCNGKIVGGLILFDLEDGCFEVGRIWVDPDQQNRGIGQAAMQAAFAAHPQATRWTLGTPSWALRNRYFYEKLGFNLVRESEVDPKLGWSSIKYERLTD